MMGEGRREEDGERERVPLVGFRWSCKEQGEGRRWGGGVLRTAAEGGADQQGAPRTLTGRSSAVTASSGEVVG